MAFLLFYLCGLVLVALFIGFCFFTSWWRRTFKSPIKHLTQNEEMALGIWPSCEEFHPAQ